MASPIPPTSVGGVGGVGLSVPEVGAVGPRVSIPVGGHQDGRSPDESQVISRSAGLQVGGLAGRDNSPAPSFVSVRRWTRHQGSPGGAASTISDGSLAPPDEALMITVNSSPGRDAAAGAPGTTTTLGATPEVEVGPSVPAQPLRRPLSVITVSDIPQVVMSPITVNSSIPLIEISDERSPQALPVGRSSGGAGGGATYVGGYVAKSTPPGPYPFPHPPCATGVRAPPKIGRAHV